MRINMCDYCGKRLEDRCDVFETITITEFAQLPKKYELCSECLHRLTDDLQAHYDVVKESIINE